MRLREQKELLTNKMDEDDKKLWEIMVSDVKKLYQEDTLYNSEEQNSSKPKKSPQKTQGQAKNASHQIQTPQKTKKESNDKSSFQVDRATAEKLRKGKIRIDARIDLHGMNKIQAHEALISFINQSHTRGHRCVLVITGKGKAKSSEQHWMHNEPGILRKSVPSWLKSPPLNNIVLKVQQAAIKDGAEGALYVLLRKKR